MRFLTAYQVTYKESGDGKVATEMYYAISPEKGEYFAEVLRKNNSSIAYITESRNTSMHKLRNIYSPEPGIYQELLDR